MSHRIYPRAPKVCSCHPPAPAIDPNAKTFLFKVSPMHQLSERYGINTMLRFIKQEVNTPIPVEFLGCADNEEQIYVRIIQILFWGIDCDIRMICYPNSDDSPANLVNDIKNKPNIQDRLVHSVFSDLKNSVSPKYNYIEYNSADKLPYDIRHFLHNVVTCFLNHFEVEV